MAIIETMSPLRDDPPQPRSHTTRDTSDERALRTAWVLPFLWFGVLGVLALVAAVVVAGNGSTTSAATGAGEPVMVTLKEFGISPATIDATTVDGLHVMNQGSVTHNLAVEGTAVRISSATNRCLRASPSRNSR